MAKNNQTTVERIEDQRRIVAECTPDTPQHRIASMILLMLQQALALEEQVTTLKAKLAG